MPPLIRPRPPALATAIENGGRPTERRREAEYRCVRCGTRPPQLGNLACAICLEEERQMYMHRQDEERRAQDAANQRANDRARRPRRTVTIAGQEFIVQWDGTQ